MSIILITSHSGRFLHETLSRRNSSDHTGSFYHVGGGTASASTLTLPSALKEIEAEAFYGDTSIDEVVLPSGATKIGAYAFAASSLRKITIPSSVKSIGEYALGWNEHLIVDTPVNSYAYKWAVNNGFIVAKNSSKTTGKFTQRTATFATSGSTTLDIVIDADQALEEFGVYSPGGTNHYFWGTDGAGMFEREVELYGDNFAAGQYPLILWAKLSNGSRVNLDEITIKVTKGATVSAAVSLSTNSLTMASNGSQTMTYSVTSKNSSIKWVSIQGDTGDDFYSNFLYNDYTDAKLTNISGKFDFEASSLPGAGKRH